MAVALASHAIGGAGGLQANAVVNKPTGTASGDLLLAVVNTSAAGSTLTVPSGFTGGGQIAGTGMWVVWNPSAGGSEPTSYTFTRSSPPSAPIYVLLMRITGHDPAAPIEAYDGIWGTSSVSGALLAPSVTATAATFLLSVATRSGDVAPTVTFPAGMTSAINDTSAANSADYAATQTVSAGATGTRSWSFTGTGSTVGYAIGNILIKAAPVDQTVSPSGIASTAALGSPSVSAGAVTVSPTGIASTAAVGTPTVSAGAVTVSPSGIGSTAAVGAPTVAAGPVTVSPGGIAPTSTVGTPAVDAGAVTVTPSGIAPTSAVGQPALAAGALTVAPVGIGSTAAVGVPEIGAGMVEVIPDGIAPTSTVGTPTVAGGDVTVQPGGIASTSAVGTPTVESGDLAIIQPVGIAPTSAVGAPVLSAGPSTVEPVGIGSTAAVGEPAVAAGPLDVLVVGISPTSAVGTPTVSAGAATIEPSGIPASSAVGSPTITSGDAAETIVPVGIPSTSKVGEPTVAVPAPADACWPVDLSCVDDWDDVIPGTEPPEPKFSNAAKERAIAFAGMTMRMLTGYRVGGCPVTYRPCRAGCSEPTWQTYPVGGAGGVPWQPTLISGQWLNVGCGCGSSCGCDSVNEIRLPTPAGHVEQVLLDGAVFTAWRLDPGGRLVRTDGGRWPLCQNLDADDTEPGTWSVTFVPGDEVDGMGAYAAGVLAGEFVRACSGDSCNLPSGVVTQVQRNGVTMQFAPGTFPGGRTGIEMVDAYLQRWNPNALAAPSVVLSPDTRRGRAVY